MPDLTLFLFDVDGVLLYPRGYKEALIRAVDLFSRQFGLSEGGLTYEEIDTFEACGLTNEWDSLAMCVSALLLEATRTDPDVIKRSLSETVKAIQIKNLQISRPDFASLARIVAARHRLDVLPSQTILSIQKENSEPLVHVILNEILGDVYAIQSPVTSLFQHLTLGSDLFSSTYNLPARFESESFLTTHDEAHISDEILNQLLTACRSDDYRMVIYTARPSLPPVD